MAPAARVSRNMLEVCHSYHTPQGTMIPAVAATIHKVSFDVDSADITTGTLIASRKATVV